MRYIIPDIHGCRDTFIALLKRVGFKRRDTCFLLGDYVDRGPRSKETLDAIMLLIQEKFDVRPLKGNHEEMMLDARNSFGHSWLWQRNGGGATLQSFGVTSAEEIPAHYWEFVEKLPLCHLEDDFVAVHAGIDFSLENPLDDIPNQKFYHHEVGWLSCPLWQRNHTYLPEKIGGRKLVCGHTVLDLDIIQRNVATGNLTLDNGCFLKGREQRGNLLAYNLDTGELTVQPNCD